MVDTTVDDLTRHITEHDTVAMSTKLGHISSFKKVHVDPLDHSVRCRLPLSEYSNSLTGPLSSKMRTALRYRSPGSAPTMHTGDVLASLSSNTNMPLASKRHTPWYSTSFLPSKSSSSPAWARMVMMARHTRMIRAFMVSLHSCEAGPLW